VRLDLHIFLLNLSTLIMRQTHQNSKDFSVLIQSHLLNERTFELALKTFNTFFYSVTPKHRNRIQLIIVGANDAQTNLIEVQNASFGLSKSIIIALRANQTIQIEEIKKGNTLLFHPSSAFSDAIRMEILSVCLPILTYSSWENAPSFDTAATIYLSNTLEQQCVKEFSNLLKIIYFDQWALQMLKNKALLHRRSQSVRTSAMAY
jgi:hypothetical protein